MVIISIISVQIGAAVAKQLFDTAGPGGVVFLRTLLAGAVFFILWRPKVRGYRKQDYAVILAYGAAISSMMLAFYAAIDRIPLGITVTIAFAGPLGVAVAGSRRLRDGVWIVLAVIGILLLSPVTETTLDPVGLFLAVLSAITWAAFILLSGRVARRFHQNGGLAIAMCVAAVFSLPFGLEGAAKVLAAPALIGLAVIVAVLSSAVPFSLDFHALKRLPPRIYSLLASLEPVVATIIGFVALHEALSLREVAGILLVTVAAAATTLSAP